MEKMIDWNALWRDLVAIKEKSRDKERGGIDEPDSWGSKAPEFKESVKRRWERPDSSRDFILSKLNSGSTVLDIGAGTGAWAALIAPHVKRVTAVEPSPAMIRVMKESLEEANITNVDIIQGSWPDISVKKHDFSLCSHAMYGYPDLTAFIRHMVSSTGITCFLLLRATSVFGVRSEAAQHIWGQPFDSPNFAIAYNVLLQMDIHANVLMEDTGYWKPRESDNLEDAFNSMKKYLGLHETGEYDHYLKDLLQRRLVLKHGRYVWPRDVRSALVYWNAHD